MENTLAESEKPLKLHRWWVRKYKNGVLLADTFYQSNCGPVALTHVLTAPSVKRWAADADEIRVAPLADADPRQDSCDPIADRVIVKQTRREDGKHEHIVELNSRETEALRGWLRSPNGSHGNAGSRVTFDAVENGGLLVRTVPYGFYGS